ncbi:NMCC_0638 family (lipo)protein [Psychrobacter glaciei]|uniref:NMCC_0638 family (lipo)protein n=1 Tax=Psychrobacter glaciei TaxID=619771 RepID=UPI001F05A61A|nr:hypothetical protein [Psychrobacter glaciei]MCH1783163.1 hypothetical protein [Psychrobacter glaciei]
MNKKAVSLILLSTLSGSILSACSDNADVKTQTPQSELTTEPKPELKIAATDSKEGSIIQTDSNAEDKAVVMSSDENVLGIKQAETFQAIYASTCMQYLLKLDELRDKLKDLPQLTDVQAKQFLKGHSGSAWPVPDDHGTFVLTLLEEKNMCAVYANKANSQVVEKQFSNMFASAPSPLTSNERDNSKQTTISGERTTLSYEWAQQGAQRKMLFMLTTDSSADADVQALFTASMIQE